MVIVKSEFKALGTDIAVQIVAQDEKELEKANEILPEIKKIYLEKERIFSRFDAKSDLSFLNKNIGKFIKASPDLFELAKKSLEYYLASQGIFDPRIIEILENAGYKNNFESNDFKEADYTDKIFDDLWENLLIRGEKIMFRKRMDFSGIAKGYVTDKIAEFLKKNGFRNFLVDSGGDIFAQGQNEKNEKWKIALEGIQEDKMMIGISNKAIATSGITRRKWENDGKKFHHLINPKNPDHFDFNLKSVTVIEDTTEKADVWAKILFLMGREKGIEFSKLNKIKSLFLDYRNNLYVSPESKKFLIT